MGPIRRPDIHDLFVAPHHPLAPVGIPDGSQPKPKPIGQDFSLAPIVQSKTILDRMTRANFKLALVGHWDGDPRKRADPMGVSEYLVSETEGGGVDMGSNTPQDFEILDIFIAPKKEIERVTSLKKFKRNSYSLGFGFLPH